jgi:hypothetical protein
MITIDPNDSRLTRSEREFLRRIELRLKADAQRRWRDLPSGHKESVEAVFGERKG